MRASAQRLVRAAKAVVLLTVFFLVCGYAGKVAWPLELFANFRVQYAAVFAACASGLLLARSFRWALVPLAGTAFCTISVLQQAGLSPTRSPTLNPANAAQRATFRLVSFNTWFRNRDLGRIAAYLEQVDADARSEERRVG